MRTHINGIPCQAIVTHITRQKPLGPWCDSDLDCYGYTDVEFELRDRKGYKAAWLEKLMSDNDRRRIEQELEELEELEDV